jgi:hypothetical protein
MYLNTKDNKEGEEDEVGGACSKNGGEEERVSVCGKARGKEATRKIKT